MTGSPGDRSAAAARPAGRRLPCPELDARLSRRAGPARTAGG
jgi:hypothetical protein